MAGRATMTSVTHRPLSVPDTQRTRPDWDPRLRVQTVITVVAYVESREHGEQLAALIEQTLAEA